MQWQEKIKEADGARAQFIRHHVQLSSSAMLSTELSGQPNQPIPIHEDEIALRIKCKSKNVRGEEDFIARRARSQPISRHAV